MKKSSLIAIICFGLVQLASAQFHGTIAASTTNKTILGLPGMISSPAYATNTAYVQGQVVQQDNRIWFAVVAGTSGTNKPYGVEDLVDGTVTWRPCLMRPRRGMIFVNNSDVDAQLGFGGAVGTNYGATLKANGGSFLLTGDAVEVPQCKMTVTAASGVDKAVYAVEW